MTGGCGSYDEVVINALGGFTADSFDMSKMKIYFSEDQIERKNVGYSDLMKLFAEKIRIPFKNVQKVPDGDDPEYVAAQFEAMIRADPSLDQSGPIPSCDLMLVGTGNDGRCGSLLPQSVEIKATGQGKVVLPLASNNSMITVTMDFMNAAKKVIVLASGSMCADMVCKAFTGCYHEWDCPAGLVNASEETLWFVDTESIAEFNKVPMKEISEDDPHMH